MHKWLFICTYCGVRFACKIKANDKRQAIDKGYMKATKKFACSNCELNFIECHLVI